jgi:hypothetical protein
MKYTFRRMPRTGFDVLTSGLLQGQPVPPQRLVLHTQPQGPTERRPCKPGSPRLAGVDLRYFTAPRRPVLHPGPSTWALPPRRPEDLSRKDRARGSDSQPCQAIRHPLDLFAEPNTPGSQPDPSFFCRASTLTAGTSFSVRPLERHCSSHALLLPGNIFPDVSPIFR